MPPNLSREHLSAANNTYEPLSLPLFYYLLTPSTMDIANLIFPRATDPIESRPIYRSPAFQASSNGNFTPVYSRSQPPLSLSAEDNQPKFSLPSISTLFEGADSAAVQPTSISTHSQIACIGTPEVANNLQQSVRESALRNIVLSLAPTTLV